MMAQRPPHPPDLRNLHTLPHRQMGGSFLDRELRRRNVQQQELVSTPRQLAYPAETQNVAEALSETNDGTILAESGLRRKTPRGTLSGAYDGTLVDHQVPVPARKHVLISDLPSSGHGRMPHLNSATPWQALHGSRPDRYAGGQHGHYTMGPTMTHAQYPDRSAAAYPPAWQFPGGIDSVLGQTLPFQPSQRHYLQYGSTVPTVLPAASQTYAGPTVSAGSGLYGPYWPDGAYIPYRPTAVRDSRYYTKQSSGTAVRPYDQNSQQIDRLYPGGQNLVAETHHAERASAQESYTIPQLGYETVADVPYYPRSHLQATRPAPFSQQQPFGPRMCSDGVLGDAWQDVPNVGNSTLAESLDRGVSDARFREKTFRWAHSSYVELLAMLQQSPKVSPYSLSGHSQHQARPKIYPKPPRHNSLQTAPTSHSDNPHAARQLDAKLQSNPSSGQHVVVDESEARPTTAIYSPHRRLPQQHEALTNPISYGRLPSFSEHYAGKHLTLRRVSGPGVYGASHNIPDHSTLHSNASAALEMMERLCEQSQSGWVEGMLLSGCLAYALGDYHKAMFWYQTILARDKAHVEAMSNLAATLLAINRREDAFNYWLAAVKLRPSYFEASEHLIGLLTSSHRGKDAVAMIELLERSLRLSKYGEYLNTFSDSESETKSRTSSITTEESSDRPRFDYEDSVGSNAFEINANEPQSPGYGSSGYAIPASDNGRLLALIHAKGNMLYQLGHNDGAAAAFEEAIMIATGKRRDGIKGLIYDILAVFTYDQYRGSAKDSNVVSKEPVLLYPEESLQTRYMLFPHGGRLPGLDHVAAGDPYNAAVQTTSNTLLSLAKIYQDVIATAGTAGTPRSAIGVRDILALYYLSLSLQPSPSTANNVGILLATVQQSAKRRISLESPPSTKQVLSIPGVVPGTGIHLALEYYNYGLILDKKHAHLFTNLGSLLKDIGQLNAAIKMYEQAVECDGNFDIALANLANAVKDQGRVADAIGYYKRAVKSNPNFAEAVCGLATALNSVCGWRGRGGIYADHGVRDRYHVSEEGTLLRAERSFGWLGRVVEIVEKQLKDGESWGRGTLTPATLESLCQQLSVVDAAADRSPLTRKQRMLRQSLESWAGCRWEGARITKLVERGIRHIGWQWYQDRYRHGKNYDDRRYARPALPTTLSNPHAPTVLPFHTFTAPLSAKQIRQISQRNALRISVSTLRSNWLPATVFPPPKPPKPQLNIGYVSSDFNNHPLAHLMQSVFGLHDPRHAKAYCYATTASDNSAHRKQIEKEAPVFYDASSWSIERLVKQVVMDGIHILVNLNGYTRGARNEVFAARPAPIQMSFMGFAGTLGAEWCDYVLADSISIPPSTLSPWRRNVDIEDRLRPDCLAEDAENWVYDENIIFAKDSFFCCDHKQSAPDAIDGPPGIKDSHDRDLLWEAEQAKRWKLRKERFPKLSDNAVILGNFNQLYKIDPSTFRMYLRILSSIPNAVLWLLRFPDLGEQNLMQFARDWAGPDTAARVIFTDVAPKSEHITRASIVDLFLDTPECNAHTTAADVVWSGTPIVTWGRWDYKMCSRMAGSIVASALPEGKEGDLAREELLVKSEAHYEEQAVKLAGRLRYRKDDVSGKGEGRLMELRRMLWEGRWTSRLFDTKRWVRDLERAYWEAWTRWERGEGGDIWL